MNSLNLFLIVVLLAHTTGVQLESTDNAVSKYKARDPVQLENIILYVTHHKYTNTNITQDALTDEVIVD